MSIKRSTAITLLLLGTLSACKVEHTEEECQSDKEECKKTSHSTFIKGGSGGGGGSNIHTTPDSTPSKTVTPSRGGFGGSTGSHGSGS